MIRARLYRRDDAVVGCRIEGHSDHAEKGRDIVCAAVSVLGSTCVNALEQVCGQAPVITGNTDGLLEFRLPELPEKAAHDAQVLMAALERGLRDVGGAYPRDVRIEYKDWRNNL